MVKTSSKDIEKQGCSLCPHKDYNKISVYNGMFKSLRKQDAMLVVPSREDV